MFMQLIPKIMKTVPEPEPGTAVPNSAPVPAKIGNRNCDSSTISIVNVSI